MGMKSRMHLKSYNKTVWAPSNENKEKVILKFITLVFTFTIKYFMTCRFLNWIEEGFGSYFIAFSFQRNRQTLLQRCVCSSTQSMLVSVYYEICHCRCCSGLTSVLSEALQMWAMKRSRIIGCRSMTSEWPLMCVCSPGLKELMTNLELPLNVSLYVCKISPQRLWMVLFHSILQTYGSPLNKKCKR